MGSLVSPSKSLSIAEKRELQDCEHRVIDGVGMVAEALLTIRDRKLYRETHSTFEHYICDKFGKTARWARLQMANFKTVKAIVEHLPAGDQTGTIVPQMPEGATRELTGLDVETQAIVVKRASENGKKIPKAKDIQEAKGDVERAKQTGKVSGGATFNVDEIEAGIEYDKTEGSILRDGLKNPVPDSMKAVHDFGNQIRSKGNKLDAFKREVLEMAEQLGGECLDTQDIEQKCKSLKDAIRLSAYYATCPHCSGDGCNQCRGHGYYPERRKGHLRTTCD